MKKTIFAGLVIAIISMAVGCNKVEYQKAPSGMAYTLIPSDTKDSLIRDGNVVKMHVVQRLNDSVIYNSYEEVPAYIQFQKNQMLSYSFTEIFPKMKLGDSAVTVLMVDTLLAKGVQELPSTAKKGDRIVIGFKIIKVYPTDDSIMRADYMATQTELMEIRNKKQFADWEKSGVIEKGITEIEDYLKSRNINAQRVGKGTYVAIENPGTGEQAEKGKYVKVKYTGKLIANDSTFESGVYPLQLGQRMAIQGWEEGLPSFKEGGKGTLYIPGFLAYGDNPRSAFKPFAAMKFDVEILDVSDQPISPDPPVMRPPQKN